MRERMACIAACLTLSLLLVSCGGGSGGTAGPAQKGADVCNDLKNTERLRYTIKYLLDSPKQESPPDNSTAAEWAAKPSFENFHLETTHVGSFVQPDKLDFQFSVPDQPAVRSIRIGENQWYQLNDSWVPAQEPAAFPFTPPQVCDAIVSPLDLAGKTGVSEKVGDTDAEHIRIAAAPLSTGALLGDQSDNSKLLKSWDVDLWLSNKGSRLVKAEAVAKTTYPYGRELSSTLSLEVGSFNDDNIADIKPPF